MATRVVDTGVGAAPPQKAEIIPADARRSIQPLAAGCSTANGLVRGSSRLVPCQPRCNMSLHHER